MLRSSRLLPPILAAWALASAGCGRSSPSPNPIVVAASTAPVEALDDPRLSALMEAAERWRRMRGPSRSVVDQVILAADAPSFYDALATWDQGAYFPILIDDPRWTLPFIRAFKPARVVRWPRRPRSREDGPLEDWIAAEAAVGRSWAAEERSSTEVPPSGARPVGLGPTPPGAVLSHPSSRSLAGAAALAAGRFQPLVRVEPAEAREKPARLGFRDVATEEQAVALARRIEARIAAVVPAYAGLGDDLDFLTLACDWPYRYESPGGGPAGGGLRAIDDLIGRTIGEGTERVDAALARWAYCGRLLGDPAASVYRAMASLFLQPESALLWNTYRGGPPWADYDVTGAATILQLIRSPDGVEARAGDRADLNAWHERLADPGGRDLWLINTSGSPHRFTIAGGPGVTGDVPFGPPSVVSMIHSFSAADPSDPATLAGRFLDRGAFVYFGSVYEPYLSAFRTPYLLSQLLVAEVPLGAAWRQGPGEAFGRPWRLAYLGDPLYTLDPRPVAERSERSRRKALPPGAWALAPRARPSVGGPTETLDWCYETTLLDRSSAPGAKSPEILSALSQVDRERLDVNRRRTFDALLIHQGMLILDIDGLLERLLKIPGRSRSEEVWGAIETAALDRVAARLRDGRFREALELWHRLVVGPWPPRSGFLADLTRRLGDIAANDPARVDEWRRRLSDARDQLTRVSILPERRDMLEGALKRLVRSEAP